MFARLFNRISRNLPGACPAEYMPGRDPKTAAANSAA
jgi:hypothetical protein